MPRPLTLQFIHAAGGVARSELHGHSCRGSSWCHMTPAESSVSRPGIERCARRTGSTSLGTGSASWGQAPPSGEHMRTQWLVVLLQLQSTAVGVDFSHGEVGLERMKLSASWECGEACGLFTDWLVNTGWAEPL